MYPGNRNPGFSNSWSAQGMATRVGDAERRTPYTMRTASVARHAFASCVRSPKDTLIHSASAGFGMFRFIHHEKSALCLHLPGRNTISHRDCRLLRLPASASRRAQQSLGFSRCPNQVSSSRPHLLDNQTPYVVQGIGEHRHLHPTSHQPVSTCVRS